MKPNSKGNSYTSFVPWFPVTLITKKSRPGLYRPTSIYFTYFPHEVVIWIFMAKILPISHRYSSYNIVPRRYNILDLRWPAQAVSSCIKLIPTIYKTHEKSSWCTSEQMLISILCVSAILVWNHDTLVGYMDFVCFHEAGNIYVYILVLRCFYLTQLFLSAQMSSRFLPI